MISVRGLRRMSLLLALAFVVLLSGYLLLMKYDALYVSTHSIRQNLAHLDATDACKMYPVAQKGNLVGSDGHSIAPVMTIYLVSPAGRRPRTGDIMEIRFPKNLVGRVRFTQVTNNGYGGSGSLEWLGEKRNAHLWMAVWDFTSSGSLQFEGEGMQLWGDCENAHDLRD